jgi:beta-mannosidase
MKTVYDLAELDWQVAGFSPYTWELRGRKDIRNVPDPDVPSVPAAVPGSVQMALLKAGVIEDWNYGLNARHCEWVENRQWVCQASLPDKWFAAGADPQAANVRSKGPAEAGTTNAAGPSGSASLRSNKQVRLRCLGLDYGGEVCVSGKVVGGFVGSFTPHLFDLTPHLRENDNLLQISFLPPPRWLGQSGYTSRMREWKPRFNYTWDWTSRLVQIGIWDAISIEVTDGAEIQQLHCTTDFDLDGNCGLLRAWGKVTAGQGSVVRIALSNGHEELRSEELTPSQFASRPVVWNGLEIEPWWPNGCGGQVLYTLTCRLLDDSGQVVDEQVRTVGFKNVEWRDCEAAPAGADPWICAVNGQAIFLQGVNWTPIRPNFADVTENDYRRLLQTYRDLNVNVLRVWGGAFLEKEVLYRLCDEMGLLVWQEFPLSSSGCDNYPPDDLEAIEQQARIAESYIERRQHHVSLLLWCGGNELMDDLDGVRKIPNNGKPIGLSHPMIRRFAEVVAANDPGRRFLATSSSGPRFGANKEEYGQGLHWDIHGPWKAENDLAGEWSDYWLKDDALFRSETGSPGASPIEIICRYKGDLPEFPCSMDNPLWRRTSWWVEWPAFIEERGRQPKDLDEYVVWSQQRQAQALTIAVSACKRRWPRCGGVILWMGHDSFPCTANTSIVDFHGQPKPAGRAVGEIFGKATDELA